MQGYLWESVCGGEGGEAITIGCQAYSSVVIIMGPKYLGVGVGVEGSVTMSYGFLHYAIVYV